MIISKGVVQDCIYHCSENNTSNQDFRGLTVIGELKDNMNNNVTMINQTLSKIRELHGTLGSINYYWDIYPVNIVNCGNIVAIGIWCGYINPQSMQWIISLFSDILALYQVPKISAFTLDLLINNPSAFNIAQMIDLIKEAQFYYKQPGKQNVNSRPSQIVMSKTCGLDDSAFTDFKSGRKNFTIDALCLMQSTWKYLPWEQMISNIKLI